MAKAYVFLNCEFGSEGSLIDTLRAFDDVKEVSGVFGTYDILTRLESSQHEEINTTISKIRKLENVRKTLSLLTVEGQD